MSSFAPLDRVEFSHSVDQTDCLIVSGGDAVDFLHRVSASGVRGLTAAHLVFTSDKGALVDAPLTTPLDDGFRMICGPGRGPDLRAWLEKWIVVDDVRIEADPTPAWRLGEPDLVDGDVIRPATNAGPAVLIGEPAPDPVDLEAWEAMSFRAGRLYTGPATSTGPNPLELGWKDLIAFDKGCYIGQEVIARLDTYDKVRRGLATMALVTAVDAGTVLSFEDRRCGSVLSTVSLEEGLFAWIVVEKSLAAGAKLHAGTKTAGTLLRVPAV